MVGSNRVANPVTKIVVLLYIFCFISFVIADEQGDLIFDFANKLKQQGEYYRSITEYMRFLHYYPDDEMAEAARYFIAKCYLDGKQYKDAVTCFSSYLGTHPTGSYCDKAYLQLGKAHFMQRNYYLSAGSLNDGLGSECSISREVEISMRKLLSRCYLHLGDWQAASDELKTLSDISTLRQPWFNLSQEVLEGNNLGRRSPLFSGLLATILPGAGHFYCGRITTGLADFLLNGLFIWGIIESFDRGNHALVATLSFFEFGFYGGNIYGAVDAAYKYNQRTRDDFIAMFESRME